MRRSHESGVLSTELALLMPVLVLFALVAVFAVQVQRHGTHTRSAADAAARTAALHGGPSAAVESDARLAAARECAGTIEALAIEWAVPDPTALRPGQVTVSLVCIESYGGIAALVGSDSRAMAGTSVSALEYWRES